MSGALHWAVLPAPAWPVSTAASRSAGRSWARVADEVIVWSAAGDPAGGTPVRRSGNADSELSLVTQVGRAFQDAHPAVTVVLDHGRHLVVDGAVALRDVEDTCWRVESLPDGVTVVDRPARRATRADPAVAAFVGALSRTAYGTELSWLAGRRTRHSLSAGFREAADRATATLSTLGYATTRLEVAVAGGHSSNVVADRPGSAPPPRGVVLVTAHLDSVNLAGGPAAPAPGADDNGSGAAGLLELARVLSSGVWRHDLRLILFGGEEQGLFGSRQYVAALPPAERARVRAVLNMDMIASRNAQPPTVLLEGAAVSSAQIADLAAAAGTYTGLRVETSLNPFASDHVPFINAGIPAVLTIEGADTANGRIHTADDVLAYLDLDYALEILRMNVAAVAGWLVPVAVPSPRPAGPVVAPAQGRLDVFVRGADSAVHHRRFGGSGWQPYESLGGV